MKELKHINKYFYKYRYRLIVGTIITIAAKIFTLYTPRFLGASINVVAKRLEGTITDDAFKTELAFNILLLLGAAVIAGIFTFLMRQTIINVSRYIEYDLKNEIYQQYQRLSLSFYKANRTGDLMNRITEDVSRVRDYAGPGLMYTINMISLFAVALFYMFSTAPKLTFYTILPLPILSVVIYYISAVIHKKSTIVQEQLSALSAFTQEAFSGISVIKAYAIESKTQATFNALSIASREKQIDLVKVQALFFPLMLLLIGISNILVIYIGGMQYINGEIEQIGTIAEFIIYVNMLTWPVATLGWVTSLVQQAEASQKRINEFLKQDPEIKNLQPERSEINGDIIFDNVHFTYPDTNIKALQGLSFSVNKGETLAIMGKTGSGKSTVLDLIGRLYETESGQILIDDLPIAKLNLYDLRSHIGYVPQEAFLFSDTIENNIRFGKENASLNEITAAAKSADVHKNIVKFKKGYQTILGERGITLSGGQKQRVSIARALIKNPAIFLFDDCLSAVDTETEEKILKSLFKVSKGKTTIIVTHRISSAKNADKILVLENGKLIQFGSHESLLEVDGYYRNMYENQISKKDLK